MVGQYASYCSTLSKTQIGEIYQKYLDKGGPGKDAKALICEFLGKEDFAEVVLNLGNDQRLIMVAAECRKEVTSTVLWLLKHKVFVKCFKATPFRDGSDLFLTRGEEWTIKKYQSWDTQNLLMATTARVGLK